MQHSCANSYFMDLKKFFLVTGVAIGIGFFGWVMYVKIMIFSPRVSPVPTQPAPSAVVPVSDEGSSAEAPKAGSGALQVPLYTGADASVARENSSLIKAYPEDVKKKMREELATLAARVEKDPTTLDAWLRIGVIKKFFGDYEGARDAWEYASIIRPANVVSFLNLGGLYGSYLKDYPRAEKNYRQAIINNPADSSGYLELASLYRYSYKEKEGNIVPLMEEGMTASDDDLNFTIYLGGYWTEKGDTAKAIENYEKALKLDPDNKPIQAEISRLKAR